MRILLVNNLFGDNARGGAERVVGAEALALIAAGHEVAVLRSAHSDGKGKWQDITLFNLLQPNLFPYSELGGHPPILRAVWHLANLFNSPAAAKVAQVIERFKPDVVHTHNLMGIGLMLPRRLKTLGVRHIHTLHDVQLMEPSGQLPAGHKARLSPAANVYSFIASRLFGSPEAVISPSDFLLKAHRKNGFFPKSETRILPNPAPHAPIDRPRPEEPPVFLFAGQLEPHKGVRTLIKAWEGWLGHTGGARLEIAGDGRLQEEVAVAAERLAGLSYLGRLDSVGLAEAYARAAFTVLPSEVLENAPTAISEGFAYGCPAVASATGGIPEMVEDGKTGFLFAAGDDGALMDGLNRAMAAWKGYQWDEMAASARRRVTGMDMERHLEGLVGAYMKR